MNWKRWIHSLIAAVIGGVANSVTAMFVAPETFNLKDLSKLAQLAGGSAIISLMFFLKKSPLPDSPEEVKVSIKDTVQSLLLFGLLASLISGCTSPVPGNEFSGEIGGRPFKFRTRKQTVAKKLSLEVYGVSATATNFARLEIGELSSTNDPQVIDKSFAGQAAVIDAQSRFLEAAGKTIGAAAGTAAKTAAFP